MVAFKKTNGAAAFAMIALAASDLPASSVHAADSVVSAEPDTSSFVRVCDAYGAGYFLIPGTDTCLDVGGRVRTEGLFGDPFTARGGAAGTTWHSRAELSMATVTDTEFGPLKTDTVLRWDDKEGVDTSKVLYANISLAGFLVGKFDSQFIFYTDYAGKITSYDIIGTGTKELNQFTYRYGEGKGFSFVVSLEDSNSASTSSKFGGAWRVSEANHWLPDIVGGVGYEGDDWGVKLVAGYDSVAEDGAVKLRADRNFGRLKTFVMAGWNTDGKKISRYANSGFNSITDDGRKYSLCPADRQYLCGWGDWAVWSGATYEINKKAYVNGQVAFSDSRIFTTSVNLAYHAVKNFTIIPEISYTSYGSVDKHLTSGVLRFERKF